MSNHYDYIFTGAGAAGLSLLTRMLHSGKFSDKKILVIDQSPKNSNDRTWCFWEKEDNFFEEIIAYRYKSLWFYADGYAAMNDISPYKYKLLRGIDFYNFCLPIIQAAPNVEWLEKRVDGIESHDASFDIPNELPFATVHAGGEQYTSEFIFNSILFNKPELKEDQYWMLQH
ncbi:MAG: lycopene cyclase family protein, partial [Flavitalea sp.]